jgi:putative ABC transport system permease protein
MNPSDIFSLAFDALVDRKVRTLLTIMMVTIGCSLVVVLNGLTAGQAAFLEQQFSSLATNVITVTSGQQNYRATSTTTQASLIVNDVIVNKIKALPYVQDVVPQYTGSVTINSYGNIQRISVLGMNPSKLTVMLPNLQYVDGSSINPTNDADAVVGDTIANPPGATTPFVVVGQTLTITYSYNSPGGKPQTAQKNYLVTAIMKPSGNTRIDNALVIDPNAANQLLHKNRRYDSLLVQTVSSDYVNTVQSEIQSQFGKTLGTNTPQATLAVRQQAASGNASFILMVGIIALIVGAVGIVTTLYNSVTERIREIGTMKAIGAQSSSILALFLVEAALIGVMGASLGVISGIGGGYLLSSFTPSSGTSTSFSGGGPGGGGFGGGPGGGGFGGAAVSSASATSVPPIYVPQDLIKVWLLSVTLSILAGIFPAWKASKLSPMVALRRE